MVSTRRRVVNEQDRFGGYNRQPASVNLDEPKIEIPDEEMAVTSRRRNFSDVTETQQAPIVTYSTRTYTGVDDFSSGATTLSPTRVAKPARREREDLMPSIKTQAYAASQQEKGKEKEKEVSSKSRGKISAKAKMTLVLYMIVVTVLAIVVIATGIAVSSINSDVSALESEIVNKNKIVFQQKAEVDKLTDKAYIAGKALENGMEKVDSAVEIELVPFSDTVNYEGRTNWFDHFCDWVSNIIGG